MSHPPSYMSRPVLPVRKFNGHSLAEIADVGTKTADALAAIPALIDEVRRLDRQNRMLAPYAAAFGCVCRPYDPPGTKCFHCQARDMMYAPWLYGPEKADETP